MKITIITVTLNCVDTIERTIQSVLAQSHDDKEYIVIDGASTDGTLDVLDKYKDSFDYYVSEPDEGIANAYNKALQHVTGDVINFMNGDDYFFNSDVLKNVSQYFLQNKETDILIGKDELNIVSSIHDSNKYKNVYIDAVFPHQAIFAKKKVYDEIGLFNENYRFVSDKDWIIRAWNCEYKFSFVDEVYAHFSPGGRGFGTGNVFEEYELAVKTLKTVGEEEWLDYAKFICFSNYCEGRVYEFLTKKQYVDMRKEFFESFLDNSSIYTIWGNGSIGSVVINQLVAIGFRIGEIIDNGIKSRETYDGIEVVNYKDCKKDYKVIIATSKYDDEIKNILEQDGWERNRFVTFKQLEKNIIEYLEQNEDEYNYFYSRTGLDLKGYIENL